MARTKGKSQLGKLLEKACAEYPQHWKIEPIDDLTIQGQTYDTVSLDEASDFSLETWNSLSKPTNPKDSVGIRKAPMSVLPANVMAEVAVGIFEGTCKYGRHNYREAGVLASVYYDATMRHLMAYWEGEDIDPDSGLSHVTKAISSLVVLRDAMMQEMLEDDRPPKSKPFYPELNKKTSDIIDKHSDKKPKHVTEKNVVR